MAQYRADLHDFDPTMKNRFEVNMIGDTFGQPISVSNPFPVSFGDSGSLTAFGRVRSADARLLGEYRYMYGSGTSVEMNDKIVGGGTLVSDQPRNCYLANVGTTSGDRVVRQTKQYHPYIAGTSNIGMLTFTFNQAKANLRQSVGMFDDLNGIIFRMNGLVPELVIRKNGVDAEVVPQTEWNVDRLDGSHGVLNTSKALADWSKSQILVIDYQWLGIGRVRVGFVIGDVQIIVHHFHHANQVTEVYMNQPSLPCRWEIHNVGITTSASQLMMICAAVYCEGADTETGFIRAVSTDGTAVPLTTANSANGYGIVAIRLKNTLVGKPNHAMARLKHHSIISDQDVQYKIVILPGSVALNGSPTWTAVPGYGWCEYTKNFALASGWNSTNDFLVLDDQFSTGSINNKAGMVTNIATSNRNDVIYQNYDATDSQILAIIGYRLTADALVHASLKWLEVK